MDQIHEIQTRGASAVEAFSIDSYTYIAIAQAQDAAGNYEVSSIYRFSDEKDTVECTLHPTCQPYVLTFD
jgi:hypothetical protein